MEIGVPLGGWQTLGTVDAEGRFTPAAEGFGVAYTGADAALLQRIGANADGERLAGVLEVTNATVGADGACTVDYAFTLTHTDVATTTEDATLAVAKAALESGNVWRPIAAIRARACLATGRPFALHPWRGLAPQPGRNAGAQCRRGRLQQ